MITLKGHIFISYARADGADFAEKLYDDLLIRRINAWLDVRKIDPGEVFYNAIERGLNKAIALIFIMTPGGALSRQVTAEWNAALNLHIPVIPILVIDCQIPPIMNVLNWIDFRAEYDAGIATLRRRINRIETEHLTYLEEQLASYLTAQKNSAEPAPFQPKIDDLKKGIARWQSLFPKEAATPPTRTKYERKASLIDDGGTTDMRKLFVGREAELEQLDDYLHKMLDGEMQVCFIAGDAGTGKTALINHFAHHAHETNDELLYVLGQCNDITGMSDSYLPFRHVLGLLTGDESRRASVAIDEKKNRLDGILKTTGRALVEIAPELIGTLIPGAGIIAALGRMGAKEKGMLKGLEEHAEQVEKHRPEIEQAQIFMQFTALLRTIAEQHPLVIVLDDLQWADMATVGLLFHLVRELKKSRILFVGLYRPGEIASGRNGKEHPLKDALSKIFNEIKRYEADIIINLNKTTQTAGRVFVDAVVDASTNKLDTAFRDALYEHTGGHALFTVELIAEMQDRGDLVLDADDNLVTSETLSWDALPARVEAVIEERIERLTDELRETLTVASVEGVDFTAQVVSRVRELKDRDLFKQLSQELEKRHQLVRENGEQKVGKKTFLQRYSFSHAYFHRYLYKSLSTGERRLLHQAVAEILEELYTGHTADVALQLGQHYAEAGDVEKAVTYFIQAGESVFKIEEYSDAQGIFERAWHLLEGGKDDYPELFIDLSWWLGEVLYSQGQHANAQNYYEQSVMIARNKQLEDKIVQGLLGHGACLWQQRENYEHALDIIDEALGLSQRLGNRVYEAKALRNRGIILGHLVRDDERIQTYNLAYEIALEINNLSEQRAILNSLGVVQGQMGNALQSIKHYEEALQIALKQRSKTGEELYCRNLSSKYREVGDYNSSVLYGQRAMMLALDIGNHNSVSQAIFYIARSQTYTETLEIALKQFEKSRTLPQSKSVAVLSSMWSTILSLHLNDISQTLDHLKALKPLIPQYKSNFSVISELLLEAIVSVYLNDTEKAQTLFSQEASRAQKDIIMYVRRWTHYYHYALAQTGIALTSPNKEHETEVTKALELYKQAVDHCGWVGILDDAILVLRLLRKVDPDDILKPIEDYLVEKREIAWINRPFKD